MLENIATGEHLKITGHKLAPRFEDLALYEGQRIEVNMLRQTAILYNNPKDTTGINILELLEGEWISLVPGRNELAYSANNQNAADSTLEWAEVVG